MFTQEGKCDFSSLLDFCNAVTLELYECAELIPRFCVRGCNVHSFNRLFCVLDATEPYSTLCLTEHGITLEMRPGYTYFVSAGDRLDFDFHGSHFLSFHLNLNLFGSQELFYGNGLLLEMPTDAVWRREVMESMTASGVELASAIRLKSLLLRQFMQLPITLREDSFHALHHDRAVFQFLKTAATAQTTCAELAALSGTSQDTLSRRFKETYGMSLKRALENALVSRAEQMLRDPHVKIKEVSRRLSFNNEYYFSHFFKQNTGVSPQMYRKTNGIR